MKRIHLFFQLFIFFLPIINAQEPDDYHPFIEDGKVWIVGDGLWFDTPSAIVTYYFGGDTIVGGHECKKWMCDDSLKPYDSQLGKNLKNAFVASLYEEGKKVYYFREDDDTPRVLYDFSGTGETVEVSFFPYPNSNMKDALITCTLYKTGYNEDWHLNYFWIRDHVAEHPNLWYEGIGSVISPEVNVQLFRDEDHQLLQVCSGSEVLYKHYLADQILSTTAIHDLPPTFPKLNRKSTDNKYYDLSGRRINTTPARSGVYIHDGKKVMVK